MPVFARFFHTVRLFKPVEGGQQRCRSSPDFSTPFDLFKPVEEGNN